MDYLSTIRSRGQTRWSPVISIQRFYIYAESGLSRQRVSIWIAEGQLHIAYRETLIGQYRCAYDRRQRRLREVSHPTSWLRAFKRSVIADNGK